MPYLTMTVWASNVHGEHIYPLVWAVPKGTHIMSALKRVLSYAKARRDKKWIESDKVRKQV